MPASSKPGTTNPSADPSPSKTKSGHPPKDAQPSSAQESEVPKAYKEVVHARDLLKKRVEQLRSFNYKLNSVTSKTHEAYAVLDRKDTGVSDPLIKEPAKRLRDDLYNFVVEVSNIAHDVERSVFWMGEEADNQRSALVSSIDTYMVNPRQFRTEEERVAHYRGALKNRTREDGELVRKMVDVSEMLERLTKSVHSEGEKFKKQTK